MTPIHTFQKSDDLYYALSEEFLQIAREYAAQNRKLYLAISGGNSPRGLFGYLSRMQEELFWKYIHFYWVDERCVPSHHPESNYGMARQLLLEKIPIPVSNVHPIYGEADPEEEARRYSQEIQDTVPLFQNIPRFDWIWLGMGNDGHTASIFPGQERLLHSSNICEVSEHPQTAQKRITLTLKVINQASRITFLLTTQDKKAVFSAIIQQKEGSLYYPATHVQPKFGNLEWYCSGF